VEWIDRQVSGSDRQMRRHRGCLCGGSLRPAGRLAAGRALWRPQLPRVLRL
jgi:hypothetical protein